ncbi:MAG: rhodanese-like domain-containing protein [Timaviella obliquedivisa GSE-PSE-MK23-08B]|jgi:rhodanese-related sulfurtransferase|nr:rhodanese-like domain-containing protein [Timaviella obliquedivisa GSE-PSE-MK23-08B]
MADTEDTIQQIKDKLPNVTPTPPGLHSTATPHELKSRLEWGEPGLTILDTRDSSAFQECRIMGAMNASTGDVATGAQASLSPKRDIYVYGETDADTAAAAAALREAGFQNVAQLQGGIALWQEIGGAVEGRATERDKPGADAYNVVARLNQFGEDRAKEKAIE